MGSEPDEDAILNFVSFTSTSRDQAISFLKANNLDSQKAINAYFEDPTGASIQANNYKNENELLPLGYDRQDDAPRVPATAPPSRPPSRINLHDNTQPGTDPSSTGATPGNTSSANTGTGLSLAEREEQELQRAVAMSLNQNVGKQESGVTSTEAASQAQFSKATRDYYDEGAWAMTLFNETSQEVILSPDPEDRKRVADEPAFIRPTTDNLYLGGFLTILHQIPLAREALLLRSKLLFDYGHDAQWWNGQTINLPKIVTVNETTEDTEWEDVLHETQRIVAFLDSTQRAFGSSDALAGLRQMHDVSSDSEEIVSRFLEAWHASAIRADPDNPLATAFLSHAYKKPPYSEEEGDEPVSRELFVFEPVVEQAHGQNLYDVLDSAIWSDFPGEALDDVWLEHVGEILVMKLDSAEWAKAVDVKIPATFYPDRYLSGYQGVSRDMRTKRLQVQQSVMKFEELINRYTYAPDAPKGVTRKELLEKTADAVPIALKTALQGNSPDMTIDEAKEKAERMPNQLRAVAAKIGKKLQVLEAGKQKALETMRNYSKILTDPSESPDGRPLHGYTLRGICTAPHVTYVLKRRGEAGDLMELDDTSPEYQWWRISFSAEDGKTRQAEKREAQGNQSASQNGDVTGYTARKVREIEVLKAAREEGRSVLLVYASDAAMKYQGGLAPSQLQAFVDRDNEAFAEECRSSTTEIDLATSDPPPYNEVETQESRQETPGEKEKDVNVFDYEVSGFDGDNRHQEMTQRRGSAFSSGTGNLVKEPDPNAYDPRNGWSNSRDSEDGITNHVERSQG